MQKPIFSIITIVFNGEKYIKGTMESVARQSYPHIEYLVIDGKSKDNTLPLVTEMSKQMPNLRYISEADKGLYDAMNKGLRMATGDFVWFLNAGDHLFSDNTVEHLAQLVTPQVKVLYGETMLVDEARQGVGIMSELSTRSLPEHLNYRDYLGGMKVVHQSFVPRRDIAPPYRIDNLCADYDWCIAILKKGGNLPNAVVNAHATLSNYLMGGMSKSRHRQSLTDRFVVMREHFGLMQTILAHVFIVFRAVWHKVMRLGRKTY